MHVQKSCPIKAGHHMIWLNGLQTTPNNCQKELLIWIYVNSIASSNSGFSYLM